MFISFSLINSQQVPDDKCLLLTSVTDFDSIPQPNARMIIWNTKDSLNFNKEFVSDLEGRSSLIIDQGHNYSIQVFKADTFNIFRNLNIEKLDYPYSVEFDMSIKITKIYTQILELDVNFATNSSIIPTESKYSIDQLYNLLKNDSKINIELASHTDYVGDDRFNMLLSQRRSESVKTYLVNKGIDITRVQAQGYGEKQPKASNETRIGRALNRRTEVRMSARKKWTMKNVSDQ
jgi:outer membrane protein OmpA-like peptidoglycan-associated protein